VTTPHPLTEACAPVHCWEHDVDETGPCFRPCIECGHLFRTAAELVTAYNEGVRDLNGRRDLVGLVVTGWGQEPVPEVTSTNQVLFCPYCLHDFVVM